MNYIKGLEDVKKQVEGTVYEQMFSVYEKHLREVLREERYGSTEATRSKKSSIVANLNTVALLALKRSFNSFCL